MFSVEYRLEIERKILHIIEGQLRSGQMSAERAKDITQYVISVFQPNISTDAIYAGITKIGQRFPELSRLAIFSKNDLEESAKNQALPKIHQLLQEGNINAADALLKKALHTDVTGGTTKP
jgi:hypothetical protein